MPSGGASAPIFIVGVPRSGTTLLRYMLCSHPRLYVPPESNFIPRFSCRRHAAGLTRDQAMRILGQMREYRPFWRDWQGAPPDPDALVDGLAELTPAALLDALYGRYAKQFGALRWGDKSPIYVSHVGLLAELFPSAQIIHIIRDPRDVTASSLAAYRGARFFYMDAYYAARRWRAGVRRAGDAGRRLPPGRYLELRYEDLVSDPRRRARQLCAFLGEEYHPAMAAPSAEARRHHHSHGIHRRVSGPITVSSAGRWRTDLSAADQRLVQRVADELLVSMGYGAADLGPPGPRERAREAALRAKYVAASGARRILQEVGVAHPTRLLTAPRRRTAGAPPPVAPGQPT